MFKEILLLIFVIFSTVKSDKIFNNITVIGYNLETEKFKKVIFSDNINAALPKNGFNKIEINQQIIPILKKKSISDIENLYELVIENSELVKLEPGCFENLPALKKISLKGNKLEKILKNVFNKMDILSLDLSYNAISIVDSDAFDDLPYLINIKLVNNHITQYDRNWFYNSPLVGRIDLRNNSISKLQTNTFENLAGEKKFHNLPINLDIILSYNKLKSIDFNAFNGLKQINNLWLDNNLLESFSPKYLKGIKVNELRLNSNKIKCIDEDIGNVLSAEFNSLDCNPLECTCLEKIKSWSKTNKKNLNLFYSEMNCVADRIENKMADLKKRLKQLKDSRLKTYEADAEIMENNSF